jgi:hypothetical protein
VIMRGVVAPPFRGCRSSSLGGLDDEMLPDAKQHRKNHLHAAHSGTSVPGHVAISDAWFLVAASSGAGRGCPGTAGSDIPSPRAVLGR